MGARRAVPAAKASGRYRFGEGPSPEYPVTTGKRRNPSFAGSHAAGKARPEAAIRLSYSITSVARARIDGGTVRPRASAVLRLTTNSNVVGCWTGRSAGLAPFRVLPA